MYKYLPRGRVEPLIAGARVFLANVALVAIWLDPSELTRYAPLTYTLLAGYVAYSAFALAWVVHVGVVTFRAALLMHVFDVVTFVTFLYFTDSITGPFFAYFVFALLAGALRWDSRGVVWTAIPTLAAFIGIGVFARYVLRDPELALSQFIVRAAYMAVTAVMITFLGAWRERLGTEMSRLAAWPRTVDREPRSAVRDLLRHVGETLEVPRLVLVWEQAEEPFVHVATWSPAESQWTHERPGTFGSIVGSLVAECDFLSPDVTVSRPVVLRRGDRQLARGEGSPLDPALQARFQIRSVLCLSVNGQTVTGRLFALDKLRLTADDLMLGEIVAREVAASMDQLTLIEQLRHAAALEERMGLARNLHDGILQSLAGIDLKLEAVRQLLGDPAVARERVTEIQELVAAEQRDLRAFVRTLKSPESNRSFDLPAALDELRPRIERQWGTRVGVELSPPRPQIPGALGYDLYLMAHEAVANAVRHGRASAVQVTLTLEAGNAHLAVIDNGYGFPFQGRHDAASLARRQMGPVSLRERATARGGSLTVESSTAGARVDIVLPINRGGPSDADPADRR